jgi:hypothetical protein
LVVFARMPRGIFTVFLRALAQLSLLWCLLQYFGSSIDANVGLLGCSLQPDALLMNAPIVLGGGSKSRPKEIRATVADDSPL